MGHLQRLHVEHIDALELSEQLETLETRSLLFVRGHLTLLGTLALDDGRASGESERRRSEQSRGRVDRRGGHAQSGGCAGNETASGEEHVDEKMKGSGWMVCKVRGVMSVMIRKYEKMSSENDDDEPLTNRYSTPRLHFRFQSLR